MKTAKVRRAEISTTPGGADFIEWQWAVVVTSETGVAGTVAYRPKKGTWQHVANWRFDSLEEFNDHVDRFLATANQRTKVRETI